MCHNVRVVRKLMALRLVWARSMKTLVADFHRTDRLFLAAGQL